MRRIVDPKFEALLQRNPGLKEAMCARSFFQARHSVGRGRYARLAREFIADARALGWRGSINEVLGLVKTTKEVAA